MPVSREARSNRTTFHGLGVCCEPARTPNHLLTIAGQDPCTGRDTHLPAGPSLLTLKKKWLQKLEARGKRRAIETMTIAIDDFLAVTGHTYPNQK